MPERNTPRPSGAGFAASHHLVWSLLSDDPDRKRDFLYREASPGRFYILSQREPADEHRLFDLASRPFTPTLKPGDRLRFCLRANPVVRRRASNGKSVKRDAIMDALHSVPPGAERRARRPEITRTAALAWLAREGERSGFLFNPDEIAIDGYQQVRIPRRNSGPIQFSTVEIEGVLQVTDPVAFVSRVKTGFGSSRAFGCGLMLLRRA
jgi:CRISPR system Cascade subunit CasE